ALLAQKPDRGHQLQRRPVHLDHGLSLGDAAVTATGGLDHARAHPALSAVRRTGSQLAAGFALLVRPPRRRVVRSARSIALGASVAVVSIAALMMLFDAWAFELQRRFAVGVIDVFNEVSDFGKSGWFLW